MTKQSFGTSARKSGKKLHSPKDYVGMIKDCRKGKMKFSDLVEEADKDLVSRGYVFSEVLGWVMPNELQRAGVSLTDTAIPSLTINSADKGWVTKVAPYFIEYMEDKKAELKMLRENPPTEKEVAMIKEMFDVADV